MYHKGRANLGAYALSKNPCHILAALSGIEKLNHNFAKLNLEIIWEGELQHCLGALAMQTSFSKKS